MMTRYMEHNMAQLDIPQIEEFIQMIYDTGAGIYACKASVDLFGLEQNDLIARCRTSLWSATSTRWPPAERSSSRSAAGAQHPGGSERPSVYP